VAGKTGLRPEKGGDGVNFAAMVHQSTQKLVQQFPSSEIQSISNRLFEKD
jgi:hypothetical protein